MRNGVLLGVMLLFSCCVLPVAADSSSSGQGRGTAKGWFWYDVAPDTTEENEPELLEDPPAVSTPSQPQGPEKVTLDVAWIKENLPILLDKAINNPSPSNLKNYFYAQRLMTDMASRFSAGTRELFMFETALQEGRRRPQEQFSMNARRQEARDNKKAILDQIFERAGLWVFYRSDCSYCKSQLPALQSLKERMGGQVLLVSMDGLPLPNSNLPWRIDEDLELSHQLGVNVTPTTFFVYPGSQPVKIAEGMLSRTGLVERTLVASRMAGLISPEEFQLAKEVHNELILESADDYIELDKHRLEQDPFYLNEVLRARLEQMQGKGGAQ